MFCVYISLCGACRASFQVFSKALSEIPMYTCFLVESAEAKSADMKQILSTYTGPSATMCITGGNRGAYTVVHNLCVTGWVDRQLALMNFSIEAGILLQDELTNVLLGCTGCMLATTSRFTSGMTR